jgi:NADPH:quinone reductase
MVISVRRVSFNLAMMPPLDPMKAAYYRQPGPPEVIEYGELPPPRCGPRQILLQTFAVAVNPIDTYIRAGWIEHPATRPTIVGCDAAGTVAEVGGQVRGFQVGDRVWTTNQGLLGRQGTFAEFSAVDDHWVYPLPSVVSFEDAAACALVGVTAHLGLFQRAQIQPGQTICVQGASGGVGLMVIQMAKWGRAKVIALVGSEKKCAHCKSFGADVALNYREPDLENRLRAVAPTGVDLYWTTSRQPDFDFMVSAMAERGTIVLMAGREARPPFPVGPFYVKQCRMAGVVMFKASPAELDKAATDISRWLAEGPLRAPIAVRLPLSQTAEAHRLQQAATVDLTQELLGKIVLAPDLS